VRSLIAVPLVHKSNLLGLLNVMDKDQGPFTAKDQELLVAFASQAATALANAELFEHTRELDRLKSDFVAVVSHEIRTPLTSIQGSLELVMDYGKFEGQDRVLEMLNICKNNVERLRVLIGDILDFSKIERDRLPLEFDTVDVGAWAGDTVASMRSIADRRGVELRLELAEPIPVVTADRVRMSQVLTNLIDNALKFTPREGLVQVTVEPSKDGGIAVAVVDSGPGIAAKDLSKLFRKFQQIESSMTRREGGLGLGLVISKGIVEGHGGRIWVQSEEGKGCRFQFILPPEPPKVRGSQESRPAEAA
jgi:signal transduction histidine kinase